MKPQTRPVIERRGPSAPRQPMKPRAWSHQDDLKAGIGRQITVMFAGGGNRTGKLIAADQFTIKLAGNGQSALTYCKGNLLGYEIHEG
jgi:hypothetical protein